MEVWQTILISLGGNTIAVAVLGWLAKAVIEKLLARDSRRYELELQAAANATIERLKNELQIRTMEHQVRFSRVHEAQAETIARTYELLGKYLGAVGGYVKLIEWANDPPVSQRIEALDKALNEFREYFRAKQIFLPKNTAARIVQFDKSLFNAAREFKFASEEGASDPAYRETLRRAIKAVNDEIPQVLELLEDEFRKLLGGQLPSIAYTESASTNS